MSDADKSQHQNRLQVGRSLKLLLSFLRPVLLLLAISLLIYLLSGIKDIGSILLGLSPMWVLLAVLCIAANFAFATLRYRSMLGSHIGYLKVLEVVMAGYLLNYASMVQGLGIGAKIGLMKTRGIRATRSLAGIWLEILFDLILTAIISAVYFYYSGLFSQLLQPVSGLRWSLPFVLIVGVVVVLLASKYTLFVRNTGSELVSIMKSGKLLSIILSTAGIWVSAGIGFYCMVLAFSSDSEVSPLLALAAICIGFITGLISMVPGGLGVREVTWAFVVSQAGVPLEIAGLLAIIYRLLSIFLIIVVLGLWGRVAGANKGSDLNGLD